MIQKEREIIDVKENEEQVEKNEILEQVREKNLGQRRIPTNSGWSDGSSGTTKESRPEPEGNSMRRLTQSSRKLSTNKVTDLSAPE